MKTILVMRAADEFSHILAESGFAVVNCPVITTEPLSDLSGLDNALSCIEDLDGIFITSSSAAEILFKRHRSELDAFHGKVFVLGHNSFDILKDIDARVVFDQDWQNAEDMLDAIGNTPLAGKRFLFVRGERSMPTIPDRLTGIAEVKEEIVYRTIPITISETLKSDILRLYADGSIAMACFFSPSGVGSFVEQMGFECLSSAWIAAIGKTTADLLRAFDLTVNVVAKRPISKIFAADVVDFIRGKSKRSFS